MGIIQQELPINGKDENCFFEIRQLYFFIRFMLPNERQQPSTLSLSSTDWAAGNKFDLKFKYSLIF